jgi:hypothetical protein
MTDPLNMSKTETAVVLDRMLKERTAALVDTCSWPVGVANLGPWRDTRRKLETEIAALNTALDHLYKMGEARSRKDDVVFIEPCVECGGQGPHDPPAHAYVAPKVQR